MSPLWPTLLALVLSVTAGAASAQVFREGAAAVIEIHYPPRGEPLPAGDPVWAKVVSSPVQQGSNLPPMTRLRLSAIVVPDQVQDIRVEIANTSGRVFDTLTRDHLARGGAIWTLMVPGSSVSVRVRGTGATKGFRFTIDRIAFMLESKALESIFGTSDLVDVSKYDGADADVVRRTETSVAKVGYMVGSASDSCTGFRVAANLVQTSSHCVPDAETCSTAWILFGYEKNAYSAIEMGQQVRCSDLVAVEGATGADTAIMRVSPVPGDQYAIAVLAEQVPVDGEPLFIVQHPGGEPKKLSIADCARRDTAATLQTPHAFGHSCDTKGGSSGAPVFNLAGLVVGQQRAGHENPNITDQPNLATPATELALSLSAPAGAPIGRAADPTTPVSPLFTRNARPMPLPIAPAEGLRQAVPPVPSEPSQSGAGSPGEMTVHTPN
jgi:V8-like Glu-specific endopeptidase